MSETAIDRFILHWGEMGSRWGINRTVAQIHALLFISEQPLTAEEIADHLGVARSNVSGSLRELQAWGVIRSLHVLGDRRTRFEALKDVWEMARVIAGHRKAREVDPTVQAVRECAAEVHEGSYAAERLGDLLELFEAIDAAAHDLQSLPTATIRTAMKTRRRLHQLIAALREK